MFNDYKKQCYAFLVFVLQGIKENLFLVIVVLILNEITKGLHARRNPKFKCRTSKDHPPTLATISTLPLWVPETIFFSLPLTDEG